MVDLAPVFSDDWITTFNSHLIKDGGRINSIDSTIVYFSQKPKWEGTEGKRKKLHIVTSLARALGLKMLGAVWKISKVTRKIVHEVKKL